MFKRKNIFTLVLKMFDCLFFSFVYDRTRFFARDPLLPPLLFKQAFTFLYNSFYFSIASIR